MDQHGRDPQSGDEAVTPPETIARESPEGVKLETSGEERTAQLAYADDLLRRGYTLDWRPAFERRLLHDIATLLPEVARLKAELAADKEFLEERIQERLDEINAEGEAFDKDSANALRFVLQHYCGETGKDTLDHPDGWNTQSAIDCIGEVLREATAREATARAEERARAVNIAQADERPDCGLPRGWPPEKPCPQCGDVGTFDDANLAKTINCPGSAANRIAAAIRITP